MPATSTRGAMSGVVLPACGAGLVRRPGAGVVAVGSRSSRDAGCSSAGEPVPPPVPVAAASAFSTGPVAPPTFAPSRYAWSAPSTSAVSRRPSYGGTVPLGLVRVVGHGRSPRCG